MSLVLEQPFTTNADGTEDINNLALSLLPQMGFFLLPFTAALLKLLYFRRNVAFGYHFIAVLHIKSAITIFIIFAVMVNGIFALVGFVAGNISLGLERMVMITAAIIALLYVVASLHVIFKGHFILNLLRSALLLVSYFILAGMATIVVVFYAAWSVSNWG